MNPDDAPLPPLPPLKLGLYRHYKDLPYEVIGLARHSETLEPMVVYRPLYGEQALWVRPYDMFIEHVEVNGVRQPRFRWEGDTQNKGNDSPR
ncbi:DUF1653 domain-containing protein [Aquabacterium sp.]|uniref:DUF1653 domain-containing protein n=1 Tax=Aquabacterium sp. TaxID=1872578 RepID=UPI0035B27937